MANIPFDYNISIKSYIFAWTSVLLIWKNIIFLILLTILRIKDKRVRIPEDASIFRRKRRITDQTTSKDTQQPIHISTNKDWSTTKRLKVILRNETEYVTYFLIFFSVFTVVVNATTTRQLVYGCIFVTARYVHNSGLIFRNSYARIIGYLLSILVLGAITLDLAITVSIDVSKQND